MNSTTKDRRAIYLIGVAAIWGTAAFLIFFSDVWLWKDKYGFNFLEGLVAAFNWWPTFPEWGVILEFLKFFAIAGAVPIAHGLLILILGAENVKATAPWEGWAYVGILIAIGCPILMLIVYYGGIFVISLLATLLNQI